MSVVEECVLGGVFVSRVSVAVSNVSLDACLCLSSNRRLAVGEVQSNYFLEYQCVSVVVAVYIFVFHGSMSGC